MSSQSESSTANSSPPRRARSSPARSSFVQFARSPAQQLVADRVAVDVVDVLEAVEVEDQQRERRAVARVAGDVHAEALLEAAAIEGPGQVVRARQDLEPGVLDGHAAALPDTQAGGGDQDREDEERVGEAGARQHGEREPAGDARRRPRRRSPFAADRRARRTSAGRRTSERAGCSRRRRRRRRPRWPRSARASS